MAVDELAALETLQGLDALQNVVGSLVISDNEQLIALTGLGNLISIGKDLRIERNDRLDSLLGLASLENIAGSLSIQGNAEMLTAQGAEALAAVGQDLTVRANQALVQLGAWPALITIGGDLILADNDHLLAVADPDQHSPLALALTAIEGALTVHNNRRLASLNGLGALRRIAGDLRVQFNLALESLDPGFAALEQVGGDVLIQGSFINMLGFDAFREIGGNFLIHGVPELVDLTGLETIATVHQSLVIHLNPKLVSIGQLSALEYVGDRLQIYANPALSDVDGLLAALRAVGSYVKIDFANGTIDCPAGTGVPVGGRPLILGDAPTQAPVATDHGNWCTFNCRYPRQVVAPDDLRMWRCRQDDMWDASWAPICL